MAFSAINEEGKKINIVGKLNTELYKISDNKFSCLDKKCNGDVYVKAIDSYYMRPHFAHKPGSVSGVCRVGAGGAESPEHQAGKWAIMDFFNKVDGVDVLEDEYIDGDVRVDVAVIMSDGRKICHEIELSRPYPQTLKDRTDQREGLGWEVLWYFDIDSSSGRTGRGWARQNMMNYGELEFRKDGELVVAEFSVVNSEDWRAVSKAQRLKEIADEAKRVGRQARMRALSANVEMYTVRNSKGEILVNGETSSEYWNRKISENQIAHKKYMASK